MTKTLFKSESERNLWIKLNAERIIYMNKMLGRPDKGMGSIDEPYTAMAISKNQLEFDEENCDKPRLSLEELLLPEEELYTLFMNRVARKTREAFSSFRSRIDPTF